MLRSLSYFINSRLQIISANGTALIEKGEVRKLEFLTVPMLTCPPKPYGIKYTFEQVPLHSISIEKFKKRFVAPPIFFSVANESGEVVAKHEVEHIDIFERPKNMAVIEVSFKVDSEEEE